MSNKQSTPSNRPAGRGRGGKGRGRGAGNSSGDHVNQWTQGDPNTRAWGKPGQGRGGNQGNATGSQGNQWMQGDAGKRAWDKPGEQARKKKAAAEQGLITFTLFTCVYVSNLLSLHTPSLHWYLHILVPTHEMMNLIDDIFFYTRVVFTKSSKREKK